MLVFLTNAFKTYFNCLEKSLNRSGNYVSNFVTCVMRVLFVARDKKLKWFPKCSLCTSFFRKTFFRVKMSPLPWGDRWSVFICSKYLLGSVCHHGKGLKTQNTSFLQKKNIELISKSHRATQNFPIKLMVKLWAAQESSMLTLESKHKVPITLFFEVTRSLTSQNLEHVVAEGAGRMTACS